MDTAGSAGLIFDNLVTVAQFGPSGVVAVLASLLQSARVEPRGVDGSNPSCRTWSVLSILDLTNTIIKNDVSPLNRAFGLITWD